MSDKTGTLDVIQADSKIHYEWNGYQPDRDKARAAFEEVVASGFYLAVAYTSPGKAKQVRSFREVEEIEREQGTVAVQVSTALVGG